MLHRPWQTYCHLIRLRHRGARVTKTWERLGRLESTKYSTVRDAISGWRGEIAQQVPDRFGGDMLAVLYPQCRHCLGRYTSLHSA
jgi:hypothetical protein